MRDFNRTILNNLFDVTQIITLFETSFSPSQAHSESEYNFWVMSYNKEGSRTIKVGEKIHHITSGQLMFYPPNITHCRGDNNKEICLVDIVSFECMSLEMGYFKNKIFTLKPKERLIITEIFNLGIPIFQWFDKNYSTRGMYVVNDIDHTKLTRIKVCLELLLTNLYTEYYSPNNISHETAKKHNQNKELFQTAITNMMQNINLSLNVNDIAKDCGVSVSSLKRVFKEEVNMGVITYFNELKIKTAMDMIQNTSHSFTQISDILGFSSPFYFSGAFKKKTGVSPMEYSKIVSKR